MSMNDLVLPFVAGLAVGAGGIIFGVVVAVQKKILEFKKSDFKTLMTEKEMELATLKAEIERLKGELAS